MIPPAMDMSAPQVSGIRLLAGQFVRFGLVGILAAGVHGGLFMGLVALGLPGYVANAIAFALAFVVSYLGHSRWTFRDAGRSGRLGRFGLTTAAGFLLNSGFAIVIVDLMGLPAWLAALPMIAVTPLVVFALLKTRVFS